jgi:hypothetical protein
VFTITGPRVHDPADWVFTIGRTRCSGSPEYAPRRDCESQPEVYHFESRCPSLSQTPAF